MDQTWTCGKMPARGEITLATDSFGDRHRYPFRHANRRIPLSTVLG